MPISPTPAYGGPDWKISIAGPDNVEFNIVAYSAVSSVAEVDEVTQSLVNHLALWPDLVSLTLAQKVVPAVYDITPDP